MAEKDISQSIHSTQSRNPLAVFAPQPEGVSFAGQEKGEKIILLLRPHPLTLVPAFLVIIVLLLAPIYVIPFLGLVGIDLKASLNFIQSFLLTIIWYSFIFGYTFYRFIFWYFNLYLLTNERIIDFDFRGILHKETAYAPLSQIQDVAPKTIGFFGTFFHFGNVFIQTAAQKPEFEFHEVARPNEIANEILEEVRKEAAEPPGMVA